MHAYIVNKKDWLELATSEDPDRGNLGTPHGNIAADGIRMHINNSGSPCQCDNTKQHQGFYHVIDGIKDIPFAFSINKELLIDALAGMDTNQIFFYVAAPNKPVVIQDLLHNRTAIVMPMHFDGHDEKETPSNLPKAPKKEKKPSRYELFQEVE